MTSDLAHIKTLLAKASPGPWEQDEFSAEDGYGRYCAFSIITPSGKAILDTSNSDVQVVHDDRVEGPDGPEGSTWDETGRQDTATIVASVNWLRDNAERVERMEAAIESAKEALGLTAATFERHARHNLDGAYDDLKHEADAVCLRTMDRVMSQLVDVENALCNIPEVNRARALVNEPDQ